MLLTSRRPWIGTFVGTCAVALSVAWCATAGATFPGDANGRIAFVSDRTPLLDDSKIYTVRPDGSDPQQLTRDGAFTWERHRDPAWSPDGRRIAYAARVHSIIGFSAAALDYSSQIVVMNADGTNSAAVAESFEHELTQPAWSPDGSRLLWVRSTGQGRQQLVIADLTGTAPRTVVDLTGSGPTAESELVGRVDEPAWSPDGKRIAFNWIRDTCGEGCFLQQLYAVPADGGTPQPLSDPRRVATPHGLSWSPRGDRITFGVPADGEAQPPAAEAYEHLRQTSLDLPLSSQLVATGRIRSMEPAWSPDDTQLAFDAWVPIGEFQLRQLWVTDLSGAPPRQLLSSAYHDSDPDWQPLHRPIVAITSGPSERTFETTARFAFSANEPGVTFSCRLLGEPDWRPCSGAGEDVVDDVAVGERRFEVRATDPDGLTSAAVGRSWVVAPVPRAPTARILTGPRGTTDERTAVFTFESTPGGATFTCQLDDRPPSACDAPGRHVVRELGDGAHSFRVTATDADGLESAPAAHTWTVAEPQRPPEVSIVAGPAGATENRTATFEFEANERGVTFACRLDDESFRACATGGSDLVRELGLGTHTFRVRGTDADGLQSAPATYTWTVTAGRPAPPLARILTGPSGATTATTASFTFAADRTDASFRCQLDDGPWRDCTAPGADVVGGLRLGPHTFRVQAIGADRAGSSPAAHTWTVVPRVFGPRTEIYGTWHRFRSPGYVRFLSLDARHVPAGATVSMSCLGSGCPSELRRTRSIRSSRTATLPLVERLRGRRLRDGARVRVTITRPGFTGLGKTYCVRRDERVEILSYRLDAPEPSCRDARSTAAPRAARAGRG